MIDQLLVSFLEEIVIKHRIIGRLLYLVFITKYTREEKVRIKDSVERWKYSEFLYLFFTKLTNLNEKKCVKKCYKKVTESFYNYTCIHTYIHTYIHATEF